MIRGAYLELMEFPWGYSFGPDGYIAETLGNV